MMRRQNNTLDGYDVLDFGTNTYDGKRPPQDRRPESRALARRHNVAPDLVRAVIAAESGENPRAVSAAGAIGLMRLMPTTAAAFGVEPWKPIENLRGGIAYLASLMRAYGGERAARVDGLQRGATACRSRARRPSGRVRRNAQVSCGDSGPLPAAVSCRVVNDTRSIVGRRGARITRPWISRPRDWLPLRDARQ